jgi:hypothetical protein
VLNDQFIGCDFFHLHFSIFQRFHNFFYFDNFFVLKITDFGEFKN